ncbi:unnamed protein product [Trichogramma brassicae]|uniref:Uncharacterized protein n=1 Tax=Trichogramma brassicae TaxID=86971 RepID=A0A6H5IHA3_9HYME|nr:unnamed protein product [Trichogramma brassicae]
MDYYHDQPNLAKLESLREKMNWEIERDRFEVLCQLDKLFSEWTGPLPNLRDIFYPEEIECLLTELVIIRKKNIGDGQRQRIVEFVVRTGYKDEPEVDKNGKPILHRTTPIHVTVGHYFPNRNTVLRELFKIYDRFDVNYTGNGVTHFHVACQLHETDIAKKFLELGQDPNCCVEQSDRRLGDPPLSLAVLRGLKEMVKLLLRAGADPNWSSKHGVTCLHVICMEGDGVLAEMLFEFSKDEYRPIQIDARDQLGRSVLYWALYRNNKSVAQFLLRKGADPNLASNKGLTPLHATCLMMSYEEEDLWKLFFEINDERGQTVQIDARDKLGNTPLQLAAANLKPGLIDRLLDRGADLSSFVFPAEKYFLDDAGIRFLSNSKLRVAYGAVAVVESLEKRGYELDRSDALTLMKLFAKYGLFEKPLADLEKFCDEDKLLFAREAKKIMMKDNDPSLSLYDLILLRPEEAAKLVTCADYYEFWRSKKIIKLPESFREACAQHLCENLSRGFFRRWTIYPFWELIHYRLPLEICEMIIGQVMNEDLFNIFLAATGQSS